MKGFTCKICGRHDIEEIMTGDLCQYSAVDDIYNDAGELDLQYGASDVVETGEVDVRYECAHCREEMLSDILFQLAK